MRCGRKTYPAYVDVFKFCVIQLFYVFKPYGFIHRVMHNLELEFDNSSIKSLPAAYAYSNACHM